MKNQNQTESSSIFELAHDEYSRMIKQNRLELNLVQEWPFISHWLTDTPKNNLQDWNYFRSLSLSVSLTMTHLIQYSVAAPIFKDKLFCQPIPSIFLFSYSYVKNKKYLLEPVGLDQLDRLTK